MEGPVTVALEKVNMKTLNILEEISSKIKPLLGATITSAALLIWPDRNGAEESDTQLNLTLKLVSGEYSSITFRTDSDGQTPLLENEDIESDYKLSQLSERVELWAAEDYWNSRQSYKYEVFEITDSDDLGGILDSELVEVELLYFNDDAKLPTGLRLVFSSNMKVWSVPGTYGNMISTGLLSNDWFEEKVNSFIIKK